MAGDWIKMQTDLYRDPKVIIIADEMAGPDNPLAHYINQNMQRDMTVTSNVMRNAVVGALVSVWGVARQQGHRDCDDLCIDGATFEVIDYIADMPGFGSAMSSVGWLIEDASGLVFPRFFEEHNVDPTDQKKAANRDRQRRYRERKRNVTGDVTGDVTVTHRVEKSREEKSKKKTGTAGVLSLVSQEMLADPKRVLDWFRKASTGKQKVLKPTETNKRCIVHLAQRVLRDPKVEDPVKVFVANVRDKNLKITNAEEDRAIETIKLIERGPPKERDSDLSSRSKSKEQQLAELSKSNLRKGT